VACLRLQLGQHLLPHLRLGGEVAGCSRGRAQALEGRRLGGVPDFQVDHAPQLLLKFLVVRLLHGSDAHEPAAERLSRLSCFIHRTLQARRLCENILLSLAGTDAAANMKARVALERAVALAQGTC
jgi:hypothetical protein